MLRNYIGSFVKSVQNRFLIILCIRHYTYSLVLLSTIATLFSLSACGTSTGTSETATSTPSETITEGTIGGGPGNATLGWTAPITNADGTPLVDLSGFKVYYGNILPLSKGLSSSIDVGNVTSVILNGLDNGTTHFSVTAYDTTGNESKFSEVISKIIG